MVLLVLLGVVGWVWNTSPRALADSPLPARGEDSQEIAALPGPEKTGPLPASLSPWLSPFQHYPWPDTLIHQGHELQMSYGTDSLLQSRSAYWMKRFRPEYGSILVGDLNSGRILAVAETDSGVLRPGLHFTLRAHYPAASLIKIITASAALGAGGALQGPGDSLPQLGSNHTLYRSQIRVKEWNLCPKIEFREAFARSVNPAFAVLGMRIGPSGLQSAAEKFGFNSPRPAGPWGMSQFSAPDSGFALAEVSCGFTPKSTISPLHALQIARAIGDDGLLLQPVFVSAIKDLATGAKLSLAADDYAESEIAGGPALEGLRDLMEATTRMGTARKGFHRAMRAEELNRMDLGGKTGSLDGSDPDGRYEWFIGYARVKDNPDHGIAIAIMLIHGEYLAVHASELAAHVIKDWIRAYVRETRRARGDAV